MIQASCETDAKPNAYVMTMSSRTLSQRDNVKRMRRLFQIFKIGGLDVNDDECLNSEYEDESLASEQLEISLESDLLECSSVSRVGFIGMFKRIDSQIEFWFFAKGGKEGRMAGKCHN